MLATETFTDYYEVARPEMLPFIPVEARHFLEIGCAAGSFGTLVKSTRDCVYVGVEPLEKAAHIARGVLDDVYISDVEHAPVHFRKAQFDCIVCNDVLEHLVDPWDVLDKYRYFLRPGGYVVASLPNVRYYKVLRDLVFKKRWEYMDWGVLDRTHLRFFTKMTMRKLFVSTGYKVERIEGINGHKNTRLLWLLNEITRGWSDDLRFQQFAVVARA